MGKRIIQQRRGRGTSTYRASKKAFIYKVRYPVKIHGEGEIISLFNSRAHTCPIAKVQDSDGQIFYIPAFKGMIDGQKINLDGNKIENGSIMKLENIPVKTPIYCIENRPGDGGKLVKSAGTYAEITKIIGDFVFVAMPSKKEKQFSKKCRAIIGVISGEGRLDKPILKAGKQFYIKKSKSKLWPRTSAIKMNVVDHPFGSGRGKVPKSKVAKRNAPPGARVGLIRPRQTGKRK